MFLRSIWAVRDKFWVLRYRRTLRCLITAVLTIKDNYYFQLQITIIRYPIFRDKLRYKKVCMFYVICVFRPRLQISIKNRLNSKITKGNTWDQLTSPNACADQIRTLKLTTILHTKTMFDWGSFTREQSICIYWKHRLPDERSRSPRKIETSIQNELVEQQQRPRSTTFPLLIQQTWRAAVTEAPKIL